MRLAAPPKMPHIEGSISHENARGARFPSEPPRARETLVQEPGIGLGFRTPLFRGPSFLRVSDPLLSVIAPCFNEELNVPELARRVLATFEHGGLEGELVLVD